MKIRVGILGYGNLGKGTELAVRKNDDMELVGVFTRRDPKMVKTQFANTKVLSADSLDSMQEDIDVLIICGGSATDLPELTPKYVSDYNVIDSFDTHARIPEHYEKVDKAAKNSGKIGIISCGWDPGLFSINRVYANSILPGSTAYTFWGKGVSQGHSDAVRRIDGVIDARQYTIPIESAMDAVRNGEAPNFTARDKHERECFVVAEEGADLDRIEKEIKDMPNYFSEYNTTVHFISSEEMAKNHSGLPHGGSVLYTGKTGENNFHSIEYSLKLDSNPEFTSSVLTAFARAAYRMNIEGMSGAKTVLDVPPAMLSPLSPEELRKNFV